MTRPQPKKPHDYHHHILKPIFMLSLALAARSLTRPRPSSRAWPQAAACITATRFLSSKKSDGSDEPIPNKPTLAAAIKNKSGAKLEGSVTTEKKPSRSQKAVESKPKPSLLGKFLPFNKLPKPPREITDMPLEQFYAKVYMRDLPERPQITPSNIFAYKFEIPSQFIRAKKLEKGSKPEQPSSSFEPAHNILDIKSEYDANNMMRSPDHPLKESITGMFVSNPLMESIDDDFLWDLYPKGKSFGHAPFGGDASFNGFRDWEKAENAKVKEKEAQFETKLNEMKDFNSTLSESKSFYRQTPIAHEKIETKETSAKESSKDAVEATTKKVGGRRKLDRGLLKQYRKYKKEGWLRRRNLRDDEDDEF